MITVLVIVAILMLVVAIDRLFFRKERRMKRRALGAVYWLRRPNKMKNPADLEAIESYCNLSGQPYEVIGTSHAEVAQWYRVIFPEQVTAS